MLASKVNSELQPVKMLTVLLQWHGSCMGSSQATAVHARTERFQPPSQLLQCTAAHAHACYCVLLRTSLVITCDIHLHLNTARGLQAPSEAEAQCASMCKQGLVRTCLQITGSPDALS